MGEVPVAAAIKTVKLTKMYGQTAAVQNLDLSVKRGEILGFLGLNGAGKTTTIRMLLGLIKPSAGKCYLEGKRVNPADKRMWQQVGYLVETPSAYPELTVEENLELVQRLRGLLDRSALKAVLRKLKLEDQAAKKAKYLSRGNAQRLGLAKALLHQPKILLLDEPASGLDPSGVVEIRRLLLNLARNSGAAVLVSSHRLDEISRIASTISIIHRGRLIKSLTSVDLEEELDKVLLLGGQDQNAQRKILRQAGYRVRPPRNSGPLVVEDGKAVRNPEKIASLLVRAGQPPNLLKVEKENLEKYFLRILKEEKANPGK
ncbi:MAG: ABC transporter ATP-binding protein [Firmicutes bacterium]|nr:ABC transporter ATP-binding protein [Bacillota bacterium]